VWRSKRSVRGLCGGAISHLGDGRVLGAEVVVGAIESGGHPLAELAGLDIGPSGGIAVNDANQTNDPDIYAVGDAVEKPDAISHATSLIALANVANRQGRRWQTHRRTTFANCAVPRYGHRQVFDIVAATVGWNERRLQAPVAPSGRSTRIPSTMRPTTGATRMAAKLIFDRAMAPSSGLKSSVGTVLTNESM